MAQKINILYIGRHPEITPTVLRLLNNNPDWNGIATLHDNEACELFTQHNFEIVLLGNGINKTEEAQLRTFFTTHNPSTKIVQHYGGGSGLLTNEIEMALQHKS